MSSAAGWPVKSRNTYSKCDRTPAARCQREFPDPPLCPSGSPNGADPPRPTQSTSSLQKCTARWGTCSGMSMQSLWFALTLCLFMEMWCQILTSARRCRSTGKLPSTPFRHRRNQGKSFYPVDACAQAAAKVGEEHLGDDDDLQGIIARSQVPL